MSNSKISALTSATTPLTGTEVLPIVQSGATKQVANNDLRPKQIQSNATSGVLQIAGPAAAATRIMTVPDANFTAARTDTSQSFTGDQTLSTGNLIQGTAAKGVNFTANSAATGMTTQLLNWYEEGIWTPVVTSGTGTITSYIAAGRYTRIGRQVTLTWYIGVTNNGTGASYIHITGAPYSSGVGNTALFGFNQSTGAACTGAINGTALDMYKYDATYPVATGQTINGSITYSV